MGKKMLPRSDFWSLPPPTTSEDRNIMWTISPLRRPFILVLLEKVKISFWLLLPYKRNKQKATCQDLVFFLFFVWRCYFQFSICFLVSHYSRRRVDAFCYDSYLHFGIVDCGEPFSVGSFFQRYYYYWRILFVPNPFLCKVQSFVRVLLLRRFWRRRRQRILSFLLDASLLFLLLLL